MKFSHVMPVAVSAVLLATGLVGPTAAWAGPTTEMAGHTTELADDNGSRDHYTASSVTNPITGEVSSELVREDSAEAVYDQHIKALNNCDWKGLMAQYPDSFEFRLPEGTLVKGRQAAAELFAGFVQPQQDGGLCGLTFTEESRQVVGGTFAVSWVADADFLAEPYRGSDAYITDCGLMVSMVSTFDASELKFK